MKVTILGSGTSIGVPQIGCHCEVCTSTDPHDKRLRCSALVEHEGVRILIDCGPDFRQQMMRYSDYLPIDAVLVTHEHYDHVGGIDDLRPFCKFRDIPIYAEDTTAQKLMSRMPYCFVKQLYPGVPKIELNPVAVGKTFEVTGLNGKSIEIIPFRVIHGPLPILGFRIGKMAWITDMLTIPDETYPLLEHLDLLFMNALRTTPHWTHQSLGEALQQVEKIHPRSTYLIHMSHEIGRHATTAGNLRENVYLTYDGMTISL